MPPPLYLHHLHFANLTPLPTVARIQALLVRKHLDYKALTPSSRPSSHQHPPNPTLLTFTPPPTYTTGRRELGTLSAIQIDSLRGIGPSAPPLPAGITSPAAFSESQRGGQTTFHGPGQLVAYLICDLNAHKLSLREHVRLLETSVIETVRRRYGLVAHREENLPGVWVGDSGDGVPRSDDRKLAAVGVHLRRYVSSFGVGVNAFVELGWFDRIVACGLPDRKATSVVAELERVRGHKGEAVVDLRELGGEFARTLAAALKGVDDLRTTVDEGVLDGKAGNGEIKG